VEVEPGAGGLVDGRPQGGVLGGKPVPLEKSSLQVNGVAALVRGTSESGHPASQAIANFSSHDRP
jgi:hypothetical protein